jgi:hypothetical protein
MKKNILFIGIIAVLFILMYRINQANPIRFVWEPTYDRNDTQPYGAYAFDKMMEASWIEGYTHSYKSITDLYYYDEALDDKNLLLVCDKFQLTESELEYLLEYVGNGGNALIATGSFNSILEDTLDMMINTDYWNLILPQDISVNRNTTSVAFLNDSIQGIPRSMLPGYFIFTGNDSISDKEKWMLASGPNGKALMLRYPVGQGNLIVSCTPLLFTNYAVLNDSIQPFIEHVLGLLKGKALVRTEYYGQGAHGESESPFRYLLSQPSLRWAYRLAISAVILFMIFTAKRKQKPIPVLKPPPNNLLDFVRSISSLYLMKNNNADIILKKYIYWSDTLKQRYGIDVVNEQHDGDFVRQFSAKTGMPENKARDLFLELDAIREHTSVSDKEMMDLITKMKID